MLRKIIKVTTPKRKAILVTSATSRTVSTKKNRLLPPTPTVQKKPTASLSPILKEETSVGKGKSGLGQAVKKGAAEGFLKAVGLDPNKPKPKKEEDGGRAIETFERLGRLGRGQETETQSTTRL